MITIGVKQNFSRVVEENSGSFIAQAVSKTIL
jgi:hypothetical protein